MNDAAPTAESAAMDLIDRIANALPENLRADYYREMRHLSSLPESDEMLRILRAMQFLVLLIERAPSEVAGEREKMAGVLQKSQEAMDATQRAIVEYNRKLEHRISQLPIEVSEGLQPQVIAELIGQDLRMHFASMPETAQALADISIRIRNSTVDFQRTALQLTNSYSGVAESARLAIDQLQTSIGHATATARGVTLELTRKFDKIHTWMVGALCVAALSVGLAVGVLLGEWTKPAAPAPTPVAAAPAAQSATPSEEAAPSRPAPATTRKKLTPHPAAP